MFDSEAPEIIVKVDSGDGEVKTDIARLNLLDDNETITLKHGTTTLAFKAIHLQPGINVMCSKRLKKITEANEQARKEKQAAE